MYIYESRYRIGENVYLITDPDQLTGTICGLTIKPTNLVVYDVQFGHTQSYHYDFEMSSEKTYDNNSGGIATSED